MCHRRVLLNSTARTPPGLDDARAAPTTMGRFFFLLSTVAREPTLPAPPPFGKPKDPPAPLQARPAPPHVPRTVARLVVIHPDTVAGRSEPAP